MQDVHMMMDSAQYLSSDEEGQSKKRKIQRACDMCRRKKIRCDGLQNQGATCSNCRTYNVECTYVEAAKKRGPPKAYIEGLENRVERMESLIRRLIPDEELADSLGTFSIDRETWTVANLKPEPSHAETRQDHGLPEEDPFLFPDNLDMALVEPQEHYRFQGQSSTSMLMQTALHLKEENTLRRKDFLNDPAQSDHWRASEREIDLSHHPHTTYTFPEEGLLAELVDLYFREINLYLPLLHRPTFETLVADGLHLRDEVFGAVLLLVCAIGSRYSGDKRVFLESDIPEPGLSAGWKWFRQIEVVRPIFKQNDVHDLQYHCLCSLFLLGCSPVQACWTILGMGIRMAIDFGAHRKRKRKLTVDDELVKRAFWVLIVMDIHISAMCGRTPTIKEEDYDLDFPVECDDEYWESSDPDLAFKQPPEQPSVVSAFVAYLKLDRLVTKALRTMFTITRPKVLLGYGDAHWQRLVADLDMALNKWVDKIPGHLRWDPHHENEIFFNQSVMVYAAYYHAQFFIHRTFISTRKRPTALSFPSLAICANAARSTVHLIDTQERRGGRLMPLLMAPTFNAGLILLLNIWGGMRSGSSSDPDKEMRDVHKCMSILRSVENRWHLAGRLRDHLYELAFVGELSLPKPSPPAAFKRERDSDSPRSQNSTGGPVPDTPTPPSVAGRPRSIAGTRRAMSSSSISVVNSSPVPPPAPPTDQRFFSLPVHSEELARLPIHGQLNYSYDATTSNASSSGHYDTHHASDVYGEGHYWFHETANRREGDEDLSTAQSTTLATPEALHDLSMPSTAHYPAMNGSDANLFSQLATLPWFKEDDRVVPPQAHRHGEVVHGNQGGLQTPQLEQGRHSSEMAWGHSDYRNYGGHR
ncbi:Gypsy retrotransposon integrase-like protein 1 [Marasmius tenuissimus]|nr:Gypsy retrotransposon integrase-like protein 1 [Marasmius tenuissimus]